MTHHLCTRCFYWVATCGFLCAACELDDLNTLPVARRRVEDGAAHAAAPSGSRPGLPPSPGAPGGGNRNR